MKSRPDADAWWVCTGKGVDEEKGWCCMYHVCVCVFVSEWVCVCVMRVKAPRW